MSYGAIYKLSWMDRFQDSVEVFIQEKDAANAISSWSNIGYSYETFTASGANITSAINTASSGAAFSNVFSVTISDVVIVDIALTLNSGDAPSILLYEGGGTGAISNIETLVNGVNSIELIPTKTSSIAQLYLSNSTNANWNTGGAVIVSVPEIINAGENPLTIIWDTPSDFMYEPVNGSFCTLSLMSETDFKFINLYTSNVRKYKVLVHINSAPYWTGFIMPDNYQEPYGGPPYPIEIIASDQLGYLRNLEWDHSDNTNIWVVIGRCLNKTDLEIDIREAVNIYEDAHDVTSADSPLDQTRIKTKVYEGFSYYEVLQDCLSKFGATIKQKDAEWHIMVIDDLMNSFNLRLWLRDSIGIYRYGSVASYDPIVSTTSATASPLVRIGPSSSMFISHAWRRYNTIQNYGALTDTFVDNYDFTEWSAGAPVYWDNTGPITVIRNGNKAEFIRVSSPDYTKYIGQTWTITQGADQRIKLNMTYTAGGITTGTIDVKMALIIVDPTAPATYYYNFTNGAWGAAAYYSKSFDTSQVFEDEIVTAAINPDTGTATLELRLYAPVNTTGEGFVAWDIVKMSLLDVDGSGYLEYDTVTETEVTVSDDNFSNGEDITLYTSDGSNVNNTSLIFDGALWTDSGLSTGTVNWTSARGETGTLVEILRDRLYRQFISPSQVLSVTMYAAYDSFSVVDTLKEINNDGRMFMCKRAEYNSKEGMWTGEFIEMKADTTNLITGWANTAGTPFDTFTSTDEIIDSAIETTGDGGAGKTDHNIDYDEGEEFYVTWDVTKNSGEWARLSFAGDEYTITAATGSTTFTATSTSSGVFLFIVDAPGLANYGECTISLYRKYGY